MTLFARIRRLAVGQFVLLTLVCVAIVTLMNSRAISTREGHDASIRNLSGVYDRLGRVAYAKPNQPSQDSVYQSMGRIMTNIDREREHADRVDAEFIAVAFLLIFTWVVVAWVWFGRKRESP